MRFALLALFVIPCICSCQSSIDRGRMRTQLASDGPVLALQDFETVRNLEPSLVAPFRLAVAPPLWRNYKQWTAAEVAIIESWSKEAVATGLVSSIEIIPTTSWEISGGDRKDRWLESVRIAAARNKADAVLLVRDVEDSSAWMNVLGVLDLTLVGCWIFPGHSVEAVSLMEGLLLDADDFYLYASAQVEGRSSTTTALAYIRTDELAKEARGHALASLGKALLDKARVHAGSVSH